MTATAPVQSTLTPMAQTIKQPDDSLPEKFDDYIEYLCKQWDKQAWQVNKIARYYVWCLAELFWRGQQLVFFNPDSWQFEQIPDEKLEDLYFINNIMLPFCEWIAATYASSNPKLIAYAEGMDDRHISGAVEAAQYRIDCLRERLWTAEDLQRECHLLMFRSLVFTRTYRDPITGKNRSDAIDPLQVDVSDRAGNLEASPILFYHDIAWNFDMLDMYGLGKIPKGQQESYARVMDGLSFKRQLEVALGNSGSPDAMAAYGYGGNTIYGDPYNITDDLTCRHSQLYFDARVYRNYIVRAGTVIDDPNKPGTRYRLGSPIKMGELYADGLKVCKLNGKAVQKYNINKNEEWGYCRYTVPATGFYGVGSENMVAQQDWFNEFGSIITSSAVYSSNGITAADTSKIKNGNEINQPGTILAFDDIMPGEDIGKMLVHYNTNGMDAALLQLPSFLKESMQFTAGANNIQASGVPNQGVGGDTATAVMNMKAVADAYSAMRLVLRAQNLARRMEQELRLFQKYDTDPVYYSKFGETQGRWLRNVDIPGTMRVRVEEDSHQPRTNEDIRRDTASAMGLGWGNPQTPQPVQQHLSKTFHLPDGGSRYDDWAVKGQKRLDAMIQTAQMAAQMMQERGIDAQMGAPFVIEECVNAAAPDALDNHDAMVQFYRDEVPVSDFYDDLDPVIKQALVQIIAVHEQGGVMNMQKEAAKQVAATEPVRAAEQEQQMQSKAMETESEQGNQQAETEREDINAAREDEKAAMEDERESRMADREDMRAEGQMMEAERQRGYEASEADKQREHEMKLARMQKKPEKK